MPSGTWMETSQSDGPAVHLFLLHASGVASQCDACSSTSVTTAWQLAPCMLGLLGCDDSMILKLHITTYQPPDAIAADGFTGLSVRSCRSSVDHGIIVDKSAALVHAYFMPWQLMASSYLPTGKRFRSHIVLWQRLQSVLNMHTGQSCHMM